MLVVFKITLACDQNLHGITQSVVCWWCNWYFLHSWFPVHTTSMNNTNVLISGDNKGYASYLMEQHMNNGALPGKVFPLWVLWLVIIADHFRVHLWLHFLRAMLGMCLLTLLARGVLILGYPVTMRPVLVMGRCVYMCVWLPNHSGINSYVRLCCTLCICLWLSSCGFY